MSNAQFGVGLCFEYGRDVRLSTHESVGGESCLTAVELGGNQILKTLGYNIYVIS